MSDNKFNELKDLVENYLIEELEIEEVIVKNPNTKLEDLDIDSIDMAELALQLQEKFNFQIENDPELMELKTINDVIDYFKKKLD
jgi:acyl carrier protein